MFRVTKKIGTFNQSSNAWKYFQEVPILKVHAYFLLRQAGAIVFMTSFIFKF